MAGEYNLNLSNGSVFTTLYPLETNGPNNVSTPRLIQEARPQYLITVATPGTNTFSIVGDFTGVFAVGVFFQVVGSTGNDAQYSVQSVSFGGGNTQITTNENFVDGTADGSIIAHVFRLVGDLTYRFVPTFSFSVQNSGEINGTYVVDTAGASLDVNGDTIIPVANGSIRDQLIAPIALPYGDISYTILDTVSSLQLPGKGTVNYGENLIENLVRMTEHFAADSSPDSNAVIGITPSATPLVGQLWYNTTAGDEGFNVFDGTAWTPDNDINSGAIIFKDIESASGLADIYITGSETNLPAPWPGGVSDQPGLVIWTQTDQADGNAIFRVLSSNGQERLRVEHSSVANDGFVSTTNNLSVTSLGESYFYGQVGIGNNGLPTLTQTLTVEGNGIGVNADAGLDARLVLNSQLAQRSSVDFSIANVLSGSIVSNGVIGDPLLINSDVTNDVVFVTGGGNVGINQAVPTVPLDVVGNTKLTGDLVVNSSDLYVDAANSWIGIKTTVGAATDLTDAMEITGNLRINSQIFASNQSAAAPTYSFTNDPTSGVFLTGAGILSFATSGTLALSINATGVLQVPSGYETSVLADTDIPNKKYVDNALANLSWRDPVRVMDTTTYANSAAFPTTGTIDGIALINGDRVLFVNVVTTTDRDVFIWDSTVPSWTADPLNTRDVGDAVYVESGTNRTKVMIFDDNTEWTPVGVGSGINVRYETQTAANGQTVFSLTSANYSPNTNRLWVHVDGVKQVIGLAYTETDPNTVTFVAPSPFVGGEIVEFVAFDELTANAVAKREQQTGLDTNIQPLITFLSLTYQFNSDNLLVFVNGQKMIKDIDYTEVNNSSITWIGTPIIPADVLEFYASVPIVAGTKLEDIDNVGATVPVNGDTLVYDGINGLWGPSSTVPNAGTLFDYITGVAGTTQTTVNVTTTAKTATNSFIQVFVNGILQREDLAGFGASGNYYVSGTNQLTFAIALVATDEILVYAV